MLSIPSPTLPESLMFSGLNEILRCYYYYCVCMLVSVVCVCLWCVHTCTCAHAPTQRAEDDMECFSVTLCFMGPRLSLNQKVGWWWGNPSNLPVFIPRWYRHQHSHTRHPSWCWKACPATELPLQPLCFYGLFFIVIVVCFGTGYLYEVLSGLEPDL